MLVVVVPIGCGGAGIVVLSVVVVEVGAGVLLLLQAASRVMLPSNTAPASNRVVDLRFVMMRS